VRAVLASAPLRVFVDTGAYFALAVQDDAHHSRARDLLRSLEPRGGRLFTSNFIVAELHALLLSRRGRELAARILDRVDRSSAHIERVGPDDEQRARQIIYQYDDKNFSLTDATSFAVMERLRIVTAFTFDRNFAQYGFQLLGA
jgi:predicted nucleic acid-binding protein